MRPANGQDTRSWAQDRVKLIVSGEFASVEDALADWDPPQAVEWVKREVDVRREQAERYAASIDNRPIHQREADAGR